MTVSGMNRWKFAKASATGDGSGEMRIRGEGDDPPIKKSLPVYPPPKGDETAPMALSPVMRPAAEGAGPPIEKKLRVRGSQELQAVQPDGGPGAAAGQEVRDSRPGRRRRRRTTRSLTRPTP